MKDVEQYLRSDEAAHDVAALLAEKPQASAGWPGTSLAARGPWMLSVDQVWSVLTHRQVSVPGGLGVSFRQLAREDIPLGSPNFYGWSEAPVGHYAVTDLGEGARALKLRTGVMEGGAAVGALINATTVRALGDPWEAAGRVRWTWNGGDLYLPAVAPADLPRRLCDVLLASYQIARLELPRDAPAGETEAAR